MSFYEELTRALRDPATVALIMESELEPAAGAGTPICPPTYARDRGSLEQAPNYAVTSSAFTPAKCTSGWHHDFERRADGEPRTSDRVIVNSVAACAGISEGATYREQGLLGVRWPAFIVQGAADESVGSAARMIKSPTTTLVDDLRETIRHPVTTWTLAHRTADSWLQYAEAGNGKQIWADHDGDIKKILLNISHESGELVYAHAPNVAVYGAWLSAGTARRHAIPRAYTCEITGYGVKPVVRGATKLDSTGGTVSEGRGLKPTDKGISLVDKGGKKPADFGFGQVPAPVVERAFVCELILRQASVRLRALDLFSYQNDSGRTQAFAAKRVYTLVAIAGHVLAGQEGFLRSGCDVVTVEERWGWRKHGERRPVDIEVPSLEDIRDALQEAIADAAEVGLEFQEPITVAFSESELGLIVERLMKHATATDTDQS